MKQAITAALLASVALCANASVAHERDDEMHKKIDGITKKLDELTIQARDHKWAAHLSSLNSKIDSITLGLDTLRLKRSLLDKSDTLAIKELETDMTERLGVLADLIRRRERFEKATERFQK